MYIVTLTCSGLKVHKKTDMDKFIIFLSLTVCQKCKKKGTTTNNTRKTNEYFEIKTRIINEK